MQSNRFTKFLIRLFKIIGITIGVLLILFIALTWIVYEKKNDWLLSELQEYVNKSQSGELKIKSTDLILLKNFPNVTVQLNDIDYFENRDSIREKSEKPIFHSDKIFIALELMPLFENRLNLVIVDLGNSDLNLVKYKDGSLNIYNAIRKPSVKKIQPQKPAVPNQAPKKIQPSKPKPVSPQHPELHFALHYLHVDRLNLSWWVHSSDDTSVIVIDDFRGQILKNDNLISTRISCSNNLKRVSIKGLLIPETNVNLECDVLFNSKNKVFTIGKTEISSDYFKGEFNGTYSPADSGNLDLNFDFTTKELKILSSLLKKDVLKKQPGLLKNGNAYAKGKVFGKIKNEYPQIDILFGMKNLSLKIPGRDAKFDRIGFDGKYVSGKARDHSDAFLSISNLHGKLPGGYVDGDFSIRNFARPYLKYNMNAKLNIDGYDEIINLGHLDKTKGNITLLANFNGPLNKLSTHQMDNKRSSLLEFANVEFEINKTRRKVSNLSGRIQTSNNVTSVQGLAFTYDKSDVRIEATIQNLMHLIFANEKNLDVTGSFVSDQFYTKDFIFDSSGTAQVMDRASKLKTDFHLSIIPADTDSIRSRITFDIKHLSANFDKLADIRSLSTRGYFEETNSGLKLQLDDFEARLTNGYAKISGDMLIPKARKVTFNAKIKLDEFPWNYIDDLADEISIHSEPGDKNLPVNKMEIIDADLNLSADLTTYPFDINHLTVHDGKGKYSFTDKTSISSEKFSMAFDHVHFIHPGNSGAIDGIQSIGGIMKMTKLKILKIEPFDSDMSIGGTNDIIKLAFDRKRLISQLERGVLTVDFSKNVRKYNLHYNVNGGDLGAYIKKLKQKKFIDGKINYDIELASSGNAWNDIVKKISGPIRIYGDSLTVSGIDIDDVIKKYNKSQNFNLTDLGAVLIAGPVGLAITKGTDFVSLATIGKDSTNKTLLHRVNLEWNINDLLLSTVDVAVTTEHNRIAFKGSVDLNNDSVPGITIAVVDKKGCSLMDQTLSGKIGKLHAGKINITSTILGPVINSVNAVAGGDCVPFYEGRVGNPK